MIFFISDAETITLDDAKEKVQTIIRRLDQRDITGFRNWVTSVISENVYSEGIIIVFAYFIKYARFRLFTQSITIVSAIYRMPSWS